MGCQDSRPPVRPGLRGSGAVCTADRLRGAGRIPGAAADGGCRLHPASAPARPPRACRCAGADLGEAMGARRLVPPDGRKRPCSSRCFLRDSRPSAWHAVTIAGRERRGEAEVSQNERPVIAIMARAPSSEGKSRLIRELGTRDGAEPAAGAACGIPSNRFLRSTAEKAVLYTPPDCEAEIRALTPFQALFLPQRGATLGERMREGARDLLGLGFRCRRADRVRSSHPATGACQRSARHSDATAAKCWCWDRPRTADTT